MGQCQIMRRLLLLLALLALPAQARPITATVYHSWYHGRTTYCGNSFDYWGVSAAHAFLPCGTRVQVRRGNRSVSLRITDRCECDSIDLSAGAAYRLGIPLDGIARVEINY